MNVSYYVRSKMHIAPTNDHVKPPKVALHYYIALIQKTYWLIANVMCEESHTSRVKCNICLVRK